MVVILVPADGAFLVTPGPAPPLEAELGRTLPDDAQLSDLSEAQLSDNPDTELSDLSEVTPPAFEQVYRDHATRIYRYCLSQLGNASDAEDLAAEVFAAAFAAYLNARLNNDVV